jgi:hypothetical protein
MIRPRTLRPRTFRPRTIRPRTLFPIIFMSPYVSSLNEPQSTELHQPWFGLVGWSVTTNRTPPTHELVGLTLSHLEYSPHTSVMKYIGM